MLIFGIVISPNPNLSYNLGITFHSIIYLISSISYSLIFLVWFTHIFRNRIECYKIPLFRGIQLFIITKILEKLSSMVAVVTFEARVYNLYFISNFALFLSNLMLLWNIAVIYILLMMVSVLFIN
jgi:hypothetical protein